MLNRVLNIKEALLSNNQNLKTYLLIITLFAVLIALEYSTPPEYVFGYLYTAPILLASLRLHRPITLPITLVAVALTLLNLFIPVTKEVDFADITNRLIAGAALITTGSLGNINRQRYQRIIAHQEAELKFQEQLVHIREDFIYTLTRDLKAPLLGAIEAIESLLQNRFGDIMPAQRQVLEVMSRSHINTVRLVQTMLDVYHNDTQGLKLRLAPINLSNLVQEVITTLTQLANSRNVQVNFDQDNQSVPAYGDAAQLEKVLTTLLTNAINYASRDGEVKILLSAEPTRYTIKVLDDGRAIPQEELPYVFERFYQGEGDRQGMALGLYLYLSRQIITAHKGKIWAENSPHGVLFGFSIPISA